MPPEDAAAQGTPGGGGGGGDRLSRLPDKILLRVMSHLKAWEAVRTCVLSKRWRHLWASMNRLDIRQPCPCDDGDIGADDHPRTTVFAEFVKNLLHRRRQLVPLDSLRLCWSHEDGDGDANLWIAYAVRHGAEEIELSGEHHAVYPSPEYTSFVIAGYDFIKTRLRILKFIHVRLDGTTLTQLSARCTCLEEIELTDCQIPEASEIRTTKLKRLAMIKCKIPTGILSVYAPNLVSLQFSSNFGYVPWIQNLGLLAASNVNQWVTHKYPDCSGPGSCNLKILKLSRVKLDDTTLAQLCSRCTSLEGLELKDCSVEGRQIGSISLKYLTMISCKFSIGFRVHAPNLVLLRCIKPFQHFPQIQKMEFLVTAAIVLDDSCLLSDCQWPQKEDDSDDSNNESDGDSGDSKNNESDGSSIYYDSDRDRSTPSDEDDDCTLSYSVIAEDRYRESKYLIYGHQRRGDEPVKSCDGEYGSKISSEFGGVGMLCSLSHVKTMDLLAHPGEVLLTRELKFSTEFKNLKILSLGEWCITPGFDELASILGHSPNLEKLFLHLDMAYNKRLGFLRITRSFVCTKLKMVKITCWKEGSR
ncbi:uncharacterized protein LOC8085036 isoform X2 [Sorghum bicolor]|uniref:uncharacterized protein LOC8085036 isoform X2 n=1 Tax=Sorghum bicolor TaxID=4558 RepID=UPI000B425CC2|nr:uncharacterized protein LOC8085036 isoform X2 [Sorghum bicolor]|eukprot:XP_021320198.1 uncharacterized protein LOC8085036 isoform X2 [Sorghum bicolor]